MLLVEVLLFFCVLLDEAVEDLEVLSLFLEFSEALAAAASAVLLSLAVVLEAVLESEDVFLAESEDFAL